MAAIPTQKNKKTGSSLIKVIYFLSDKLTMGSRL